MLGKVYDLEGSSVEGLGPRFYILRLKAPDRLMKDDAGSMNPNR